MKSKTYPEKILCHICHGANHVPYCLKNNYQLYKCKTCNLVFVHPTPTSLEDVYSESYFQNINSLHQFGYASYDKDKEPMSGIFISYIKRFEEIVKERKIFDIGAATGYFLDLAKKRGWNTNGIEISKFAANEARSRGHNVYTGKLPEVSINDTMEVVTMWDVLEHVDSPRRYLQSANNLLVPGGYLAINTVDISSLWARLLGSKWHLIVPPEHLYYYTPKNLTLLLNEVGFEVIQIQKEGKLFSLAYIFGTLARWQKFSFWDKCASFFSTPFWRRFGIPLNLHDNMFVLAKKIRNTP